MKTSIIEVQKEPHPKGMAETFCIVEQEIDCLGKPTENRTVYEVGFPTRSAAEKVVKDYYREVL